MIGTAKFGLTGSRVARQSAATMAGTSSLSATTSRGAAAGSVGYGPTGYRESFVVPLFVTVVYVECWGGQGGDAPPDTVVAGVQAHGGYGGYAASSVSVTPGVTYYVRVGSKGQDAPSVASGPADGVRPGGFNGGGDGYGGGGMPAWAGSGGGGATDLRSAGDALSDRIVIAAGGGGAAAVSNAAPWTANGGAGGGTVGSDGDDAGDSTTTRHGGKGGTTSIGGLGGGTLWAGGMGSLGQGGGYLSAHSCSGGGGGRYGGGAGGVDNADNFNVTAGGGSSFGTTTYAGIQVGHGFLRISWAAGT